MIIKKMFINTMEEDEECNPLWGEQEVRRYYDDLKKNNEYDVSHMSFDEWLMTQEQFKEINIK